VFYTSGRTSNEAAFAYQLFVRIFGTNNLPDCSNICHESSGLALKATLGNGKGSVTLEDFQHADCILIIAQNPGTNHPRMLTTLQDAAERGARIISLNPLLEAGLKHFIHPQKFWTWMGRGTAMATLHLPVKVNGDIAALNGIMKVMLEAEDRAPGSVFDHAFITGRRALILPCLGRTEVDRQAGGEQLVSVENSMAFVHPSQGNLAPGSEHLRSEVAIVAGLAQATFQGGPTAGKVDWEVWSADYDRIRDQVERVVPGFERYNQRLRSGGFHLPHAVRDHCRFETPSGKAEFTIHPIPRLTLPEGGLLLITLRSHDQFNTTIYGLNDRYRGVTKGRRVIFLKEADLERRGLLPGLRVDLTSHFEGETRRADGFLTVPYDIPEGCTAAYYPETNVLVPIGSVAAQSNTPAFKSIVITLAPG
jgi:anaerobic selenocysteine-containing dehydrogenase